MRADLKNGKTVITLHEADKRAFTKARDMLRFIETNSTEPDLNSTADTGASAIDDVLKAVCAATPENDTGKQVDDKAPTKQKVA